MSLRNSWLILLAITASIGSAAELTVQSQPIAWQQVESALTFHALIERELYTSLDRTARIVFAAEVEKAGHKLDDVSVNWTLTRDGQPFAAGSAPMGKGGVDVTFPVSQLTAGRYALTAKLMNADQVLAEKAGVFRFESREAPPAEGTVPLMLPRGLPLENGTWPVHAGVPFPKGTLWDAKNVRVIDAAGREIDADVTVRDRWDSSGQGSIRWLGVQFQPATANPSWPAGEARYRLEFGPAVARAVPAAAIKVTDSKAGIDIDTGAAQLRIARDKFNVIDQWSVTGGPTIKSGPNDGLYVVDHRGTTYRAANDRDVELTIEEQSAMHVVVRAAGWYVRSGAPDPPTQNLTLPTDKLCRFITRIEAYAGKPQVRVINTLIITFDTFSVRLRDAGMTLPLPKSDGDCQATFGIEEAAAVTKVVTATGVRGVQHLHDAFTIEDGDGKSLAEAQRSAGWVAAQNAAATLSLSLRDTWQRYPKEFEVLPDAIKLHVWPAHGRLHPQINPIARNQMHKLFYAHEGNELNLAAPWDYYFAACEFYKTDSPGVYEPVGHVMAAVHATGLGVSTTSDVLIQLASPKQESSVVATATCFQVAPHAVADPKWTCASLALGYVHPHDPAMFPTMEQIISDAMRGYWKYQDMGEMFGMWIYRSWLHSAYRGDGAWELYRLYNGTHHQEAIMPWLLYARSGDPFYLKQGMANIRQLTDVQMIHHEDERYMHKDFHSHQKPLVGSTKHDDCIAPWGNDHGILGHLCNYNAVITAYYLTGDLRLREVVVDEWQNTLLTKRDAREYLNADRSNTAFAQNPRDNSSAVGDILDVYQLTYDPRLLALLAPRMDIWLQSPGCMGSDWGQPLHNMILFRGSEEVQLKLMKGVAVAREGKQDLSLPVARPNFAPHELFALAGILDPAGTWAFDAVTAADLHNLITYTSNRAHMTVNNVFCTTGDFVTYLPRVMYALAHSARPEAAAVLGQAQPAPRATGGYFKTVVRKDLDREFKVYFSADVKQKNGFDIHVFDPTGAKAASLHVGPGYQAVELAVPSDGKTGEYVLFIGATQDDDCYAPFTSLPEVYVTTFYAGHFGMSQFFTRAPSGGEAVEMTFTPHKGPAIICAADRETILARTDTGETLKLSVGVAGVWVNNRCGYMLAIRGKEQPAVLAVSPERWFMPTEASLALKPPQ